jgi:hypothetical protein
MINDLRKQSKRKWRAYSVATCLNLWKRAQSPPAAISWVQVSSRREELRDGPTCLQSTSSHLRTHGRREGTDTGRSTHCQSDEHKDSDFALGCQCVANLEPRYPSSFPSVGVPPVTYRIHATPASTASALQRAADALEEAIVRHR